MIHCSVDQLVAVVVVNPRVTGMRPVAVSARIDDKGCQRAVRLLLGRERRQLDDKMSLLNDLLEHGGRIINVRCIALKKLLGSQHDLVGGFAPAASSTHAVSHYAQHATGNTSVGIQVDLVLLIVPVALMDSGGCGDSITFGHRLIVQVAKTRFMASIDVLSDEAARTDKKPWT